MSPLIVHNGINKDEVPCEFIFFLFSLCKDSIGPTITCFPGKKKVKKKRKERRKVIQKENNRSYTKKERKKEMEEEKKMMMMVPTTSTSPESPKDEATSPSWKLYENPFYNSHSHHHNHHHHRDRDQTLQKQHQCQSNSNSANKNLQCLHLPLSARKLAASFWDLTFFRPVMESELDQARAQIADLKTELEYERKARKKLESMNKRLVKELTEERKGREALEKMCEEMAKEISFEKSEIVRMRKEIDEERKMMRISEVLREERVQMKLAEAKIFLEEKLLEFESSKPIPPEIPTKAAVSFSGKFRQLVLGEREKSVTNSDKLNRVDSVASSKSFFGHEKSSACTNQDIDFVSDISSRSVLSENMNSSAGFSSSSLPIFQRKSASPEAENPHIRRGIKGFVEFPRVVRAIGSKHRHWGTKLECQKAQLRILLKQKSPIGSNSLVMS
ncbi:stress response protein NST1 [Humulus lupulus]|uniref:stress response protein NST1 n=1 Tax=Humulus lupulus TaxID=3486 RepID=UPI002B4118C3|nr:stress response protein NST1 [Humulus lupulus]